MLKQWTIKLLSLAVISVSSIGLSCGDYCGDYGAFYDVGGYNLYSFAIDVGTYVDYSYTDMNWGGGCGSLYGSCGSTSYSLGCDTSGIDLQIQLLSNQINSYINTNTLINSGSLAPIDTTCILMGTCGMLNGPGFGMPPGIDTGGTFFPGPTFPTNPTFPTYPVSNPFPTYPVNNFPSNPFTGGTFQNPGSPQFPTSPTIQTPPISTTSIPTPPSFTPPYTGSFPPPSGPITRNEDLKRPPVYQPVTTQTGNDPIRYRVPRGVVTH